MHDDSGGEAPTKEQLKRQLDALERLAGLMRRLNEPDGRPTEDFLAAVDRIAEEVQDLPEPFPDNSPPLNMLDVLRRRTPADMINRERARESKQLRGDILRKATDIIAETLKPSPAERMNSAICDGDLEEVRCLLDAGVSPDALTTTGSPLLKTALIFGHNEIADLLRERGATYGILEAALAGDTERIAALTDADREVINQTDRNGAQPLYLACNKGQVEAVRLLLERGADPNHADENGHTPLATVCIHGFPEIADLLVKTGITVGMVEAAYLNDLPRLTELRDGGADIETRDIADKTPLMAASACGHVEVVRFLLACGADCSLTTSKGLSPLNWAITRDHVPVIHLLIDHGANPNAVNPRFLSTPLINAVTFGKLRSVEALLARGADPNVVVKDGKVTQGGKTALHACMFAVEMKRIARMDVMVRIAECLLDAGADIEARNSIGYTPLMQAAYTGCTDMVRLLLSHGADVRATDHEGIVTPLSQVRRKDSYDKSGARTLIMEALGPEYSVYDAAERGDLTRLTTLLNNGAPADQGIVFNPRMLKDGPPYLKREEIEYTPLSAAASEGHIDVVRLLLGHGDIRATSKSKALFLAEIRKRTEVAALLREAGAVNKLADRQRQEEASA